MIHTEEEPFGVLPQFLSDLHALGELPAPEPSRRLAAVFADGVPVRATTVRSLSRRVAVLAAAAITTAGLTGVAAAKDVLPGPAERAVTRVVDDITPFHLGPAARPVPKLPPVRSVPDTGTGAGSPARGVPSGADESGSGNDVRTGDVTGEVSDGGGD